MEKQNISKDITILFSILNIVLAIFVFCVFKGAEGVYLKNAVRVSSLLCFVMGGLLPLFLMVLLHINVTKFNKERLIIFLISLFLCLILWTSPKMVGNLTVVYVPLFLLAITTIYFICKVKNIKELSVVFLSNPLMYYLIIEVSLIYVFSQGG